jgi:hypothetical protein
MYIIYPTELTFPFLDDHCDHLFHYGIHVHAKVVDQTAPWSAFQAVSNALKVAHHYHQELNL